jgi:hypothetical protein
MTEQWDARAREAAAALGLPDSRMISASKSEYRQAWPDHIVLFNGHIADGAGKRLWWGDLDLTLDEAALVGLAAALETSVYVFFERQAHRPAPGEPLHFEIKDAVLHVSPDGKVAVNKGWKVDMGRDAGGRLVWKPLR